MWPGCKRGHKAKHAPGFAIETDDSGSYRLATGAGFRHRLAPPGHPASDEWPEIPEIQFSATELLGALAEIRDQRDRQRAEARELEWEHGTLLEQLRV